MVEEVTALVVMVNVAVVAPAATVTVAGVDAELLLLDKDTEMPPVGALPERATVPVEEPPPTTLAGLSETDESEGGVMVRFAVWVTPL